MGWEGTAMRESNRLSGGKEEQARVYRSFFFSLFLFSSLFSLFFSFLVSFMNDGRKAFAGWLREHLRENIAGDAEHVKACS